MTNPFVFDPFAAVWEAFKTLYPGKGENVTCAFDENIKDDNGKPVLGTTDFLDDGSIVVLIDCNLKVCDAVEILAHELAHVAAGMDADHGPEWEKAFDAIYDKYDELSEACAKQLESGDTP